MAIEDQILDQLKENNRMLSQVISGKSSGSTTASLNSASADTSWMSKINTGTGVVLDGFGKLVTGSYKLSDALSDTSALVSHFGSVGALAGTVLSKLGGSVIAVNDSLRVASENGIYFANNLSQYQSAVSHARMSLAEFNEITRNNITSIAGLGAGMDKSAQAFLKIAKDVQQEPMAYALQATGVRVEEFGKILSISTQARKFQDLTAEGSQKAVAESTVKLAVEMDNLARLYGISRQEQQRELERQMAKAEVLARLDSMSTEEQSRYISALNEMKKYGTDIADLFEEITTGGIRTAGGTASAAAADVIARGTTAQLEKISEIVKNGNEDQLRAALGQLDELRAQGLTSKETRETVSLLGKSNDAVSQSISKQFIAGRSAAATEFAFIKEAMGKGISYEQAKAQYITSVKAQRSPEGSTPEATTSRTINQFERAIKDASATSSIAFKALNDKLADTIKGIGGLNQVLRPYTVEGMAAGAESLSEIYNKTIKAGVRGLKINKRTDDVEETLSSPPAPKMQDGTLGAFGALFADFGKESPALLHGKEAVLNEKQFKNMFSAIAGGINDSNSDLLERQVTGILKNVQTQVASELGKVKQPEAPVNNFGEVFNNFTNTLTRSLQENKTSTPAFEPRSEAITEVKDQLVHLNMLMGQLIAQTSEVANNTGQQVRATKKLSGNMLA